MPRDDRVEALVELDVRVDGVQADRVTQLAEALDRRGSLRRGQVVEDRLGHQEIRGRDAGPGFELRHLDGRGQREVDVVAEEEVSRLRVVAETREAVAAGLRGVEELAVVREVEGAGHASTSTSNRAAAASARRSASRESSATAIT